MWVGIAKQKSTWLPIAIFLIFFLTRMIGLNNFVTVDEPAWFLFASNFYFALTQGDFEQTIYEYHPGVTTLWLITAAYLSYFPGFRLVMKGYTAKYWVLDGLFVKYQKSPLKLLINGRFFSILSIGAVIAASVRFFDILLGFTTASAIALILIFDPVFWGHSRLLNHEAMMTVAMMASLLSILVYLYEHNQKRYLFFSAVMAGLALLTKSPAFVLIPLVGLVFLVNFLEVWKQGELPGKRLPKHMVDFFLWLLVICLVYFILWPGMWVDPGRMLYEVFGNAFSYAFQGARLSVTQDLQPAQFNLEAGGLGLYLQALIMKTTPIVWLGVILYAIAFFIHKPGGLSAMAKRVSVYFAILGLLLVLMFGLAQGRNHLHYILAAYLSVSVIAGIGWGWVIPWMAGKVTWLRSKPIQVALLLLLVFLHAIGGLAQYPYYYSYINPIASRINPGFQDPGIGYGEGLEKAAAYLAAKPDSDQLVAMSWYAAGPFSFYFPGTTHNLLISDRVEKDYIERMKESDYLVIYSINQKRVNMPAKLLFELQAYEPEKKIEINDREYVEIYAVDRFPDSFFSHIVD